MIKIPFAGDFDLIGKKVLLRVDLNSPIEKNKVVMNDRIEQASKSIKFLQNKKAKVIVIAHQGRPGDSDFCSLEKHIKLLNKFVKIKFVKDIYGKKTKEAISEMRNGNAILLENVRMTKQEFNNSDKNEFVEQLSSACDFYVNDAFSVTHREQASVTGFPKKMKSASGILIKEELEALEKIKMKNVLYILGGMKAEENLLFMQKGKKIIVGGLFGQLCMNSNGFKFGKHEKFLDLKNLDNVKKSTKGIKFIHPVDFAVLENGKRKEISLSDFPNNYEIFDIGEKSMKIFEEEIMNAKAIFMKGPFGYITDQKFLKGTEHILKSISKSKAFTVLGGGHLTTALKKAGINKNKFDHISLSGGALANYVAGKKLPGIEVLKK
jgi:phosphoglycerate kinase